MKGSQPVDLALFAKFTNRPLPELYLPRTNESFDTVIHRRQEDRLVVTAVMTPDTSNCVKCLRGVIRNCHRKRSPLLDYIFLGFALKIWHWHGFVSFDILFE